MPILKALVDLGGSGRVADVLEKVAADLRGQLLPDDVSPPPSSPRTMRWTNSGAAGTASHGRGWIAPSIL